jgi:hypothetical protein
MENAMSRFKSWWSAPLPAENWTIRHTMRYGRNPAKTLDDYERYLKNPEPKLAWLGRAFKRVFG